MDLNKLEAYAKHGDMGPYSAQFVELIALIRKQEAALKANTPEIPDSSVTVDTHDLVSKMTKWECAERGAPALAAWDEIIAHIDAHVAAQVAAAVESIDLNGIEQYRMQMAGISTAALGYWTEADTVAPEYDTPALRDVAKLYAKYAALSAQEAAPVVANEGSKLEHECEFLQDWLQTADDPCGRECCGHGVGGECFGDADPVFMTYPEFLSAMQARLKEVTALLSSQPSPAPVAMTDDQIIPDWPFCNPGCDYEDPNGGHHDGRDKFCACEAAKVSIAKQRAILAAQQEAV